MAAIAARHIGKADSETVALQVCRQGAIAFGAVVIGHPDTAFTVAIKAKASSALGDESHGFIIGKDVGVAAIGLPAAA